MSKYTLGNDDVIVFDSGGTQLRIYVMNLLSGKLKKIAREEMKNFPNDYKLSDFVLKNVDNGRVGICAAGVFHPDYTISAPNVRFKEPVTFPKKLHELGCEVKIGNDVECAAYFEGRLGVASDVPRSATVTFSSGCGVQLFDRRFGVLTRAEFGHLPYVLVDGIKCGDGEYGHIESYVSGNGARAIAIQDLLMREDAKNPIVLASLKDYNKAARKEGLPTFKTKDLDNAMVYKMVVSQIQPKHVYSVEDNDVSERVMDLQSRAIGTCLSEINGVYAPLDKIVVMGSLATQNWDTLMVQAIGEYQQKHHQHPNLPLAEIVKSVDPLNGCKGAGAMYKA